MRLEQLTYLIEISKNHSLSAAAQKLHLTSQALSKSIQAMEEELGVTLLDRSFKGVTLTIEGIRVMDAAKHFLSDLKQICQEDAAKPIELSGSYTLPIIYGEVNQFMLKLLVNLACDFPDLIVHSPRYVHRRLVQLVDDETVDVALGCQCSLGDGRVFASPDRLLFQPLLPCRLMVIVPQNYPISVYKTISLKSLQPYPILVYQESEEKPDVVRLLEYFGCHWHIVKKPSSILCQEMALSGCGVYIQTVFQSQIKQLAPSPNVVYLPLRDPVQMTFGYFFKEGHPLSVETHVILAYIKQQAETMLL